MMIKELVLNLRHLLLDHERIGLITNGSA